MKKIILITTAVLLILSTVCGCSKRQSSNTETESNRPPIWELEEGETRAYQGLMEEYSDSLRTEEEQWLTDGKLDYDKIPMEGAGVNNAIKMIMPESVADQLDNRELVDFLLANTQLRYFGIYDSWELAYCEFVNSSNVFFYILERPDIEDALCDAYIEQEMPGELITDQGVIAFLEITLAQDEIYNKLTDEQKEKVEEKKDEIRNYKEENDIIYYNTYSFFDAAR